MFINFRWAFEFLFKSFDISGDTKLIEKMEDEGIRFLMLIKRHWVYAVWHSWRVLVVAIITLINIYLLAFSESNHDTLSYVLAFLLAINISYWIVIVIGYIKNYYTIQGAKPYIEDIYTCIKKSKLSDEAFTNFFNQTIFLLIMLAGLTVFSLITSLSMLVNGWDFEFGIHIMNSILMTIQLGLFYSYLSKMINTEMDFKIVVPKKIHLFNQKWVYGDSQIMNSNKIKTINTHYSSFFSSFFNYGDIVVLSEWDNENNGEMLFDFIGDPSKTVKEMQKVLDNDLAQMEKEVNILLQKFKEEIGITDIQNPENFEKLKYYVSNNEDKLKAMFEKADEETKNEIRELFILVRK